MPNRMISLERNTNETQIDLTLDLDGTGRYQERTRRDDGEGPDCAIRQAF